jgi:hypothetical protein
MGCKTGHDEQLAIVLMNKQTDVRMSRISTRRAKMSQNFYRNCDAVCDSNVAKN